MRKFIVSVIVLFLIGLVLFVLHSLKGDEQIVQANYLMLSCEGCFHMEVEKSTDKALVNKTIIPKSKNIEEIVENGLKTNNKIFCLKGRAKLFDLNLIDIDPEGIEFIVEEVMPLEKCGEIKA